MGRFVRKAQKVKGKNDAVSIKCFDDALPWADSAAVLCSQANLYHVSI
jgi:hypothetical protein